MAEFKLKRGYDIPLAGAAEKVLEEAGIPDRVALVPENFRSVKPRLSVKEGDAVKVGTPLFTDKQNPDIKFVSPVSGTVSAINRGERRRILEIVVENDKKGDTEVIGQWKPEDVAEMQREDLVKHMQAGGVWPFVLQRPFSVIANGADDPRDIFISGFGTAPLAAKTGFLLKDKLEHFQLGIDVLNKLTSGKVYLSLPKEDSIFSKINNVEKNVFSGPHPAGNVGVQIHHIKPLLRGQLIWQVSAIGVAAIGAFFESGAFPSERTVAVAGSQIKNPKYFKTIVGAQINSIITEDNKEEGETRIISGNVLTGRATHCKGYLGFYDTLISAIPEGENKRKLLAYARPGFKSESFSRTFMSSLIPGKKEYALDTLIKGGHRALVMSASDYERVMPMDILPVHLIKSILAGDIDEMEGLGIHELDEEDVALCSYICLSKTDFGKILRDGLDLLQKEG